MAEPSDSAAERPAPAKSATPVEPESRPRPPMKFDWMRDDTDWGVRAEPGPAGLGIDRINIGAYGEIPEVWGDDTMRPRGARPIEGAPRMGYSVMAKAEMWTDNAAPLYEEAIQRRWKPATDIDWASIPSAASELERARAQLLTILAEQSWVQSVTYGDWLKELSYGYYEVKVFLATVVFSLARHTEAFRKRAMLGEGGVGMQGPSGLNRRILAARDFSEMVLISQLVGDSFMEVLLGYLAANAGHPAEAKLYTLARQDRVRTLAFGQERIRLALEASPDRLGEFHGYLNQAEMALATDLRDTVSNEALAIVLGGDVEAMPRGAQKTAGLRRAQARAYLQRLKVAGIDRERRQFPTFALRTGQITRAELEAMRAVARQEATAKAGRLTAAIDAELAADDVSRA